MSSLAWEKRTCRCSRCRRLFSAVLVCVLGAHALRATALQSPLDFAAARVVAARKTQKNKKHIALLIDGDSVHPSSMSAIREALKSTGHLAFQQVYVRENNSGHFDAVKDLHVKVCKDVSRKGTVDLHIIIDAMKMAWTSKQRGVSAIAIASTDADFTVVANEIRTSSSVETYGLWPAGREGLSENLAACYSAVLRYGTNYANPSTYLESHQEAEIWRGLCALDYVGQELQELHSHAPGTAKRMHLDLFCYLHGLPWPANVSTKTRRKALAKRVYARLRSGEALVRRPNHLLYFFSVRTGTGGNNSGMSSGRSLIMDARGMTRGNVVRHVLEFLGFAERWESLDGAVREDSARAAFGDFVRAQRAFQKGVPIEESILELALPQILQRVHDLFTHYGGIDGVLWARRTTMEATNQIRSAGGVLEVP